MALEIIHESQSSIKSFESGEDDDDDAERLHYIHWRKANKWKESHSKRTFLRHEEVGDARSSIWRSTDERSRTREQTRTDGLYHCILIRTLRSHCSSFLYTASKTLHERNHGGKFSVHIFFLTFLDQTGTPVRGITRADRLDLSFACSWGKSRWNSHLVARQCERRVRVI